GVLGRDQCRLRRPQVRSQAVGSLSEGAGALGDNEQGRIGEALMPNPSRGEIWRVDFEPVRGHEQGRVRPALIVSSDIYNHGPAGLVTVVPMTTKGRPIRSFLRVDPPEGGLQKTRFL